MSFHRASIVLVVVAGCHDPAEPQGTPPDGVPPARVQAPGTRIEELPATAPSLEGHLPAFGEAEPVTPVMRVPLPPDEPARLDVTLQNGHCFRAVAMGQVDIDLFLYEQDGTPLQQDTTPDARPVLGLHRPICPLEPTVYRMEIHAVERGGPAVFQVFRDRVEAPSEPSAQRSVLRGMRTPHGFDTVFVTWTASPDASTRSRWPRSSSRALRSRCPCCGATRCCTAATCS